MALERDINDIMENARMEMLFAVKERIADLTRGTYAPIHLREVIIRDDIMSTSNSFRLYEITNVFLDDEGRLCGDIAGKDDRYNDEVLFGKDIEDLPLKELKLVMNALYAEECAAFPAGDEMTVNGRREGLYGFLQGKKAGISRMLRRNA